MNKINEENMRLQSYISDENTSRVEHNARSTECQPDLAQSHVQSEQTTLTPCTTQQENDIDCRTFGLGSASYAEFKDREKRRKIA